jgi:hypothetical protein
MRKAGTSTSTPCVRRYRERLRASGGEGALVKLPRETIALLDELKQRRGLSRSLALLQMIERGRDTTR